MSKDLESIPVGRIIVPTHRVNEEGEFEDTGLKEYILDGCCINEDVRTTIKALNAYYGWLDEEGMVEVIEKFLDRKNRELMAKLFGMETSSD